MYVLEADNQSLYLSWFVCQKTIFVSNTFYSHLHYLSYILLLNYCVAPHKNCNPAICKDKKPANFVDIGLPIVYVKEPKTKQNDSR